MARSREETEDAGEGYFASISDLMVGILFVFLLMLAVFAINYADEDKDQVIAKLEELIRYKDREITELKELIKQKDRDIAYRDAEIANLRLEVESLRNENIRLREGVLSLAKRLEGVRVSLHNQQSHLPNVRRALLFGLQDKLASRRVEVEVDADAGILRLKSDGLFVDNEDRFTPEGSKKAIVLLEELVSMLPCFSLNNPSMVHCDRRQEIFETVLIEGHTDTRDTNRLGGNWALSTDRARAFLGLIGGVTAPLLDLRNSRGQTLIGLAGYGPTRHLQQFGGEDARNRRIEIRFLLTGENDNSAPIESLDTLQRELERLAGGKSP